MGIVCAQSGVTEDRRSGGRMRNNLLRRGAVMGCCKSAVVCRGWPTRSFMIGGSLLCLIGSWKDLAAAVRNGETVLRGC